MSDSTTITIRVDRAVKERLEIVARRMKRSKSFIAGEAIQEYLAVQDWQDARIREALAAVERGEVIANDDVVEWVESWGTDNELPVPKA
jgi:predicted transcriptional regulator